ncbi:hypothetical protein NDU88_000824 [Pleurodeles waltl]|uniref:Uncharacterized protein n=1 Tax=Pleurodeles waltl TaxID=8319 RepID=A0AAV7NDC8_PLEWA|nr:hypothetical protein NDU88_000824 [Pleurodeles waltl]
MEPLGPRRRGSPQASRRRWRPKTGVQSPRRGQCWTCPAWAGTRCPWSAWNPRRGGGRCAAAASLQPALGAATGSGRAA